jgi:cyclopropane fatty-acyl-phospholipid synthase-like methyltransferase
MDYEAQTREAWSRASTFPTNKEEVYAEHGIVQEFDLIHGKTVLEYGCGAGSDAISYLKRGNQVVAVDIIPENIEKTKANIALHNLSRSASVIKLDVSHPIPFGTEIFDVVSSHGVIHHIVEGPEVVKEFYRVLKHGGFCYLMLYTEYMYEHFLETINKLVETRGISKEEAFCWCSDGEGAPYAIPYTEEEGNAMLEAAGFRVVTSTLWLNDQFRTWKACKL